MWLWVSGTGPPQDGLSGSGRVGNPKAHRPPTFHLGSAPATGTDREHPGACLPPDQSTRVGAASPGVRSRAGRQRLGQGGPTAPGRDPPPCQGPHSVPRKGPGRVLRGGREAAPGLFWGFCLPIGNPASPAANCSPPHAQGCQQSVGRPAKCPRAKAGAQPWETKAQPGTCSQSSPAALVLPLGCPLTHPHPNSHLRKEARGLCFIKSFILYFIFSSLLRYD